MNLDDLQKLCDAATEGPWTHHRQQHCPQINCHEIELRTCHGGALYRSTSYGLMEVDGEFICAARTEIPKLIKAIKLAKMRFVGMELDTFAHEIDAVLEEKIWTKGIG